MNTNLLNLDNDILNIIGDYVKKDNIDRIDKEKEENFEKVDIFYNTLMRIVPVKRKKNMMRILIVNYLFVLNIKEVGIIDEYLTLKNLNLKNKKYSYGKNCTKQENLQENLNLFHSFIDDCKRTNEFSIFALRDLLY